MKLYIISNFLETLGHHGTVDRDQHDHFYDFRGKAEGCFKAAKSLPKKLKLNNENEKSSLELTLDSSEAVEYQNTQTLNKEVPPMYLEALYKVHSLKHIESLKTLSSKLKPGEVNQSFGREADVWSGTYNAAISSLCACLACVDSVTKSNNADMRAFANVWPPGHHAEGIGKDGSSDIAMGFCYFSNAAVAAMYARSLGLRTLVIDIDNHSGNGTRKALMNERDLAVIDFVYCSPFDSNRGGYLDGFFDRVKNKVIGVAREFPYRHDDQSRGIKAHPVYSAPNILSLEFTGKEYIEGVGIVEPAATPAEIMMRYTNEVLPWIRNFDPQLIIWSVGLDSAADDPLGALGFSPTTFYTIIRTTGQTFPNAKTMGIMEGGYKVENWEMCLWPVLFGLAEKNS